MTSKCYNYFNVNLNRPSDFHSWTENLIRWSAVIQSGNVIPTSNAVSRTWTWVIPFSNEAILSLSEENQIWNGVILNQTALSADWPPETQIDYDSDLACDCHSCCDFRSCCDDDCPNDCGFANESPTWSGTWTAPNSWDCPTSTQTCCVSVTCALSCLPPPGTWPPCRRLSRNRPPPRPRHCCPCQQHPLRAPSSWLSSGPARRPPPPLPSPPRHPLRAPRAVSRGSAASGARWRSARDA